MADDYLEYIQQDLGQFYEPQDPILQDRGFMRYLYDMEDSAAGFMQEVYDLRRPKPAIDEMYGLFRQGPTGRNQLSQRIANYMGSHFEGTFPEVPSMSQMRGEQRDLFARNADGTYRMLGGQEYQERQGYWRNSKGDEGDSRSEWVQPPGRVVRTPGGEASIFATDRQNYNLISTLSPAKQYETPSFTTTDYTPGDLSRFNQLLPNGVRQSKTRGEIKLTAVRNKLGRYDFKDTVVDFDLNTDPELQQQIGKKVRSYILANFDNSGINNISGTLRKSIETAEVQQKVGDNSKSVTISVTLADLTRPPRPGRDIAYDRKEGGGFNPGDDEEQRSTRWYGAMVFDGRRAIIASDSEHVMRFYSGYESGNLSFGGWHTTYSVTASKPHPEVFQLTPAQISEVSDYVFQLMSDALKIKKGVE
jgi:hypothetical protein